MRYIINYFKHYLVVFLTGLITLCVISVSHAEQEVISLFPLNNYDQKISSWIKPDSPDFDKPLLSKEIQQKRMTILFDHYFGELSPWNADYINKMLQQLPSNDLKTAARFIRQF